MTKSINKELGAFIKWVRNDRDILQKDMAKKMKMSRSRYSCLESGKHSKLNAYAKAFKILHCQMSLRDELSGISRRINIS